MKKISVPLPDGFEAMPTEKVGVFRLKQMNMTLILKRDSGELASRSAYWQECVELHKFVQRNMHKKTIVVRIAGRRKTGSGPDDWAYYVVYGDKQIEGFKVSAKCLNDVQDVVEEKRRYNPIPASMTQLAHVAAGA